MIHVDNVQHGYEIAQLAELHFNPLVHKVISRASADGNLLGGVVYSDHTGRSINMHVGANTPKWLDRKLLWMLFHYPFIQLGVEKIIGQVPAAKTDVLDFDLRIGFKVEARIKDVFPSGDLIVIGMYRPDCRWI